LNHQYLTKQLSLNKNFAPLALDYGMLQKINPMKSTPIKTAWIIAVRPLFVVILLTFALFRAYAAESDSDATQWILNVQPVIPITLNKDWNLITRTIMPIINQPSPAEPRLFVNTFG